MKRSREELAKELAENLAKLKRHYRLQWVSLIFAAGGVVALCHSAVAAYRAGMFIGLSLVCLLIQIAMAANFTGQVMKTRRLIKSSEDLL